MTLPGWRLRAWAVRWCDPRTMTRLVDPILADLQAEHHEAVTQGSIWGSRLAWLRAILALARAGAVHSTSTLASAIFVRPYEERRHLIWTLLVAGMSLLVFVPVLCAPAARYHSGWGLAYIVPSVIPVAVPAGLVCGIVLGLGEAQRRLRACVLALSLVASFGSFYLMASVVPVSNQVFREIVGAERGLTKVFRGVNELSLTEIKLVRAEPATYIPEMLPFTMGELAYSYHGRWSLACAPVILVVSMLAMARGRRRVDAGIAIAILVVHFARFTHTAVLPIAYESPITVAWAPNVIVLLMAIGAMLLRSQRPGGLDAGSGSAPRSAPIT
jgi:hypothetical protein